MRIHILTALFAVSLLSLSASAQTTYAPAGDRIKTRWAADVSPQYARPEHPRPQLLRGEWQSLNGLWNYAVAPKDAAKPASEGQILVPFPIQSSLSGVGRMMETDEALWYERTFTVPSTWKKQQVLLHFEAVDWSAEVWVNGKLAGSHTGGYAPFSFNITPFLKKVGKQQLVVKVWDPMDGNAFGKHGDIPRGKQVRDAHGIWYTSVTGIWQSVWLEPVAPVHVLSYAVNASVSKHYLAVTVDAEGLQDGDAIRVELLSGGSGLDVEHTNLPAVPVVETRFLSGGKAVFPGAALHPWTPDDPYLYPLRISILRDQKVLDTVYGYTAYREVSLVKDAKGFRVLGLNGTPLFNYGPLDQGWWPDGLYTAPTEAAMVYDLVKTKDLGFNMIRKHVKVEPARWYYWCDRLGLMVWQDMPSMTNGQKGKWRYRDFGDGEDAELSDGAKANYYKEWGEIIAARKVFPCITVWVPFNEAWGQFDTEKAVEFTKAQDPTRLVNAASGGNHRACGDILDCHHYPNPSQYLWSTKEANVVGEYGGIGLPLEGHLWQPDKNWGYIQHKTPKDVTDAYERYALQLLDLVGRGTSGAVYTQTTDCEIEVNGLLTYDREVLKVDEGRVRSINRMVINALK